MHYASTARVLASYLLYFYISPVELEAVLPRYEDHVSLAVTFPTGSAVADCCYSKVGIACLLKFSSLKPISMSDYIIIHDKTSNIRYLKQCQLTVIA